jgi:hypothetical protein
MADVSTFDVLHPLNRLLDLDEVLCGGDDIEDDLYSILFNSVVLTI